MSEQDGGPKRRINWLAVRTYYMAGHSAAECSQRYGVSVRQVQRKATEEGWGGHRRDNVAGATQDVAAEINRDIRKSNAVTMLTHIEYADKLLKIAMQGEEDLAAMEPGRSRIEARKAMLEAADKAVRIAREVRGFRTGDASESNVETDAPSMPVTEIRKNVVQQPADYLRETA